MQCDVIIAISYRHSSMTYETFDAAHGWNAQIKRNTSIYIAQVSDGRQHSCSIHPHHKLSRPPQRDGDDGHVHHAILHNI
jgi:hypothetical protein